MNHSSTGFTGRVLVVSLWVVCALAPAFAPAATITADGSICTLADAIRAANTNLSSGGCPAGDAGLDVIQLTADESISVAEAALSGSTAILGGSAGLPDVTSPITIQASGAGDRIERDASLNCTGPTAAFRIVNVLGAGDLTLIGITLTNGCIAPAGGDAWGGGIYLATPATLTLQQSALSNNTARGATAVGIAPGGAGFGGGVHGFGGTLTITNSTVTGNQALGGDGSAAPPGLAGSAGGGAIELEAGTLTATGTLFSTNSALGGFGSPGGNAQGGAILLSDGAVATLGTSSFLVNIAQGGDSASTTGDAEGGALAVIEAAAVTSLTDSTFVDNLASSGSGTSGAVGGGDASGGAMHLGGTANGAFERLIVRGNRAFGGWGAAGGVGAGGGIYSSASLQALRSSHFPDNVARGGTSTGGSGGASFGGGVAASGPIQEISGSTFSGNRAEAGDGTLFGGIARGGGLSLDSTSALSVTNTTIHANVALGGTSAGSGHGSAAGGGLYDGGALTTLKHVTVTANQAQSLDASTGGGISGALTLDNSVLADNLVTGPSPAGPDCAGAVVSAGFNHVESPGACVFAATGDVVGSDPLLGTFGDNGCTADRLLPGGACVPTVLLALTSLPVDAGSCTVSAVTVDERGFPRPVDIGAIANAADACDSGAFELQASEVSVDLALTKTAPVTNPEVGDTFAFVLTVTNQDALNTATGVTVSDPVPAGLQFVSSGCGATENAGIVTWTPGSLAPAASVSCTLHFQRLAAAAISNQATVDGVEFDPDPIDNVATADLQLAPGGGGAEIPTLGEWAIGIFALSLAALGVSRLRG